MKPPFTTEQFFSVFADYNLSVFPMQLILVLVGIFALLMVCSRYKRKNFVIAIYLSFIWLWSGLVYHIGFFSELNKPAFIFGGLFALQGFLVLYDHLAHIKLNFSFNKTFIDGIGIFLILFGIIIYPLISWMSVGEYNHIIAVGLPCPTTIATIGFLMLNKKKTNWYLFIIPSLWSIVGVSAALNFGVYQDFMMLFAAIIWISTEKMKRKTLKEVKAEVAV